LEEVAFWRTHAKSEVDFILRGKTISLGFPSVNYRITQSYIEEASYMYKKEGTSA